MIEGRTLPNATQFVFAIRMSAIGDTIVATRALARLKDQGFEPVLVTAPGNADVARAMVFLRWYVTHEASELVLHDKETGERFAPARWPICGGPAPAILDLHRTARSRRAVAAVKAALAGHGLMPSAVHGVAKHTLRRSLLVIRAFLVSSLRGQRLRSRVGLAPLSSQPSVHELQRVAVDGLVQKLRPEGTTLPSSPNGANNATESRNLFSARGLADLPTLAGETPAPQSYVCFVPGASGFVKQWPKELFRELARGLVARGVTRIVILGGPQEAALGAFLAHPDTLGASARAAHLTDATGTLSLAQTFRVLEEAAHVFTGDTFAAHVVDLTGTPATVFFGGTSPALGFAPLAASVTILNAAFTCSPCTRHGLKPCRYSNLACLHALTPDRALATFSPSANSPSDKAIFERMPETGQPKGTALRP